MTVAERVAGDGVARAGDLRIADGMDSARVGQVAVVFASQRNRADDGGHAVAVDAMDALAARQPGYRGMDSARGPDGFGITVSYWADDAAALAWRDHPDHRATRDAGRGRWYDSYTVAVATVTRGYDWRATETGA